MEKDRVRWKSARWLPTFPPVRLPSLNNSPTASSPESIVDHWTLSPADTDFSTEAEGPASRGPVEFSNSPEASRRDLEHLERCRQQRYGNPSSSCFSMTSSMSSDNGEMSALVDDVPFGSDAYPPTEAHRLRWEGRANVQEFSRSDLLAIKAETKLLEKRNAELKHEAEQLLHDGNEYVSKAKANGRQIAARTSQM